MNREQLIRHNKRLQSAQEVCAMLKPKYDASICLFDRTVVMIKSIDEKHFSVLCAKYRCSGYYNGQTQTAIITNFWEY